jgi:DNA processing protein
VRRAWLLGTLNARLEYTGRDAERLRALLELDDSELIAAVGGKERARLLAAYVGGPAKQTDGLASGRRAPRVWRVCRHDASFPPALAGLRGGPRLLHVSAAPERLAALAGEPTVAIVGTRTASDYGMQVAHDLARGLAASGVTVVACLAEGIGAAALTGALAVEGPLLAVLAGGLDVSHPATWRALHRRVLAAPGGCALAELPCGVRPRSWCHTARARIVAGLARMVIVVEARERPGELLAARLASADGRLVGAVPGRVTSPLAAGCHALVRDGAVLVRGAQDVLDTLYGVGMAGENLEAAGWGTARRVAALDSARLDPAASRVLEEIAAGRDTLDDLIATGQRERGTLLALARLELAGAVARGDGGRYVARRAPL